MRILRYISTLLLCLFLQTGLSAQTYELRGSVREWVKNYTHEPQDRGLLETRVKFELLSGLGESSAFKVRSYYIYDGVEKSSEWDFQEAYIDIYFEWADIRFGKQITAWGKADELNPTDILNPQRLGNFTEEKNIRKTGLTMIKSDFRIGENTLSLIWKPEFDYNRIPSGSSRFSFIPIPGLENIDPDMPSSELDRTEWAVKFERTLGFYDISASYFDGWDNIFSPVFTYDPASGASELQNLIFHRTKMFGADFAGSVRSFGLWGEFAYFYTEDSEGENPQIKNPYVQMVIGSDYSFMNGISVNFQYFREYITKIDNDTERDNEENMISRLGLGLPLRQALSSRISRDFGSSEQHSAELFCIYDIEKEGFIFQPKIKLSPEDALVFELGLVVYGGKTESMFGRFGKNDEVSLKATYSY